MSIVTAIIPCYNAATYLGQAIESVKAQTMPVAEILVIDDGSGDNSVAIAQAAGARVLFTGGQRGAATGRNLGAREARTPYLAFLDADDCWLPTHCETLVGLLQASPAAAVAFGRIQQFGAGGDIPTLRRHGIRNEGTLPELLLDNPIPQSAAVVERSKFLDAGGYREDLRYAEDYDLWLRLAEQFPIVASDAVTCRYRVHGEQLSLKLPAMIRWGWEVRFACRTRLQARDGFTAEHERKLGEALADDLRSAWVQADRESLDLLLGLAGRIEDGAELQAAIRTRIRLLPLRRLVLAVRTLGSHGHE